MSRLLLPEAFGTGQGGSRSLGGLGLYPLLFDDLEKI